MSTLHTDTLKTILRRAKQHRAIFIGLIYPSYLVIRLSIAYERLMSLRFGTKHCCPSTIRRNFQNFGFLIFTRTEKKAFDKIKISIFAGFDLQRNEFNGSRAHVVLKNTLSTTKLCKNWHEIL